MSEDQGATSIGERHRTLCYLNIRIVANETFISTLRVGSAVIRAHCCTVDLLYRQCCITTNIYSTTHVNIT